MSSPTSSNVVDYVGRSPKANEQYNSNRIHAVDSINGSQNLNRQNIGYNHFNKPVFIASGKDSLVYTYNVLDERIKAVHYDSLGQVVKTTWYAGPYEKVVTDMVTKHYYYINSPEGPVALAIQTGTDAPVIYYLCKDHLGSITGIMNSNGDLLEEYNYDPWGRRRNQADWSYSNVAVPSYTNRGFTGHEHLDIFNLIDMNGRVYDSEIARFLSPDPIIQNPYNILNYNRYSYCLNNPLKYTDPSGYSYQRFMEIYLQEREGNGPGTQFFNNYPGGWGNNITHKASNYYTNYQLYQEAKMSGYKGNFDKFQTELYKQIQVPQSFGSQRTFIWHTWLNSNKVEKGVAIIISEKINHSVTINPQDGGDGSSYWLAKAGAIAVTTSVADGPIPIGEVIGAAVITTAAIHDAVVATNNYLNKQGVQYTLRTYTGDIYKIGQTTQYDFSTGKQWRYSQPQLDAWGVTFLPEFPGNRVEILMVEKMKIWNYIHTYNTLPPGNKVPW